MNTVKRVIQELGLDKSSMPLLSQGAWNGREVSLGYDVDRYIGNRAEVRIAAASPSRLRIRHESTPGTYLGWPPKIEFASAPARMEFWADDVHLVEQIFADAALRERVEIAITAKGDSIGIDQREVRVYQGLARFDSDYSAYWAAWHAATAVIEHLGLGIPDDGTLPWFTMESVSFP